MHRLDVHYKVANGTTHTHTHMRRVLRTYESSYTKLLALRQLFIRKGGRRIEPGSSSSSSSSSSGGPGGGPGSTTPLASTDNMNKNDDASDETTMRYVPTRASSFLPVEGESLARPLQVARAPVVPGVDSIRVEDRLLQHLFRPKNGHGIG